MKKKFITALLLSSLAILSFGCNKKDSNEEVKINLLENAKANISLSDTISVDGSGVIVENNKITIKEAGTYGVSGTLKDGQIVIDAGDEDNVELVLNGANITNSKSSPIYVANAKNAYILLNDGTENVVTDGSEYVFEASAEGEVVDEPSAAIFSKDDLFIDGNGSLTVNANYRNGIASKDDLEVLNGNITITSKEDGVRGKDSVTISNGNIKINSGSDGVKSNNDTEEDKGYVLIEGGVLNITSGQDGIQGETLVTIKGGELTLSTGGGSENSSTKNEGWGMWGSSTSTDEEEISAKGIKAGVNLIIEGGTINIDSSDDSIHSNGDFTISGGEAILSSGDDGIHADNTVNINNGTINITKSYEGIEGKVINLNDGDISVIASDDGINVSGGSDGSSVNGRQGQNFMGTLTDGSLNINGGTILVDASGDGLDSNGSIYMKGGLVIVNGPINDGNGALDYDGTFDISGGTLVAAGSSGMAETPSSTSTQNSIGVYFKQNYEANTLVSIKDSKGNEILTFAPTKAFQSIIVSKAEIKTGETYTAYVGGTSKSSQVNGLYENGGYTGGNEEGNITVESSISTIGSGGMMMPGGGGRGQEGGNRGGFDPSSMPQGGDPNTMTMPDGFDPENMPEGMPMPEGFDPKNMPEGFDPSNMPQGRPQGTSQQ